MILPNSEKIIFNEGERLIPGRTHDLQEVIRHKSSYGFFKRIIEQDLSNKLVRLPLRILDYGCGVGHGCALLAGIPGAYVVGVDVSLDCIAYAKRHYGRANIDYHFIAVDFMESMPKFDYIVSRGVIEHIPNGLELVVNARWGSRLIFNVPYNEPPGNPHHVLLGITEKDFAPFKDAELFYEDLDGVTYDSNTKPPSPNMITCVCSHPSLPRIESMGLPFPLPAWGENTSEKY
ncbi:class I SAM-dependent methyltransferase [Methylocaldum sp. BRCS4]|jgi:SAM-dependent methyltransferase|uniref:class I SAM-dependent methyltransferase n=1 Tax=Methylocaldum sp. GT1TLB TaxID=3438965 RepID=UPI0012ECB392|nr:class I SAM-dependent methyltransferase [Methylocaldum sp. BRCS4]